MKLSLCILGIFVAALSVILMGCLHEDESSSLTSRLTAAEAELSTVQGELSTVRGDLTDAQNALRECQDKDLGALKVINDYSSGVIELYISSEWDSSWGPDLTEEVGGILEADWPNVRYFPLAPGTYDILAVFANGNEHETVRTISPREVTILRYFVVQ